MGGKKSHCCAKDLHKGTAYWVSVWGLLKDTNRCKIDITYQSHLKHLGWLKVGQQVKSMRILVLFSRLLSFLYLIPLLSTLMCIADLYSTFTLLACNQWYHSLIINYSFLQLRCFLLLRCHVLDHFYKIIDTRFFFSFSSLWPLTQ